MRYLITSLNTDKVNKGELLSLLQPAKTIALFKIPIVRSQLKNNAIYSQGP